MSLVRTALLLYAAALSSATRHHVIDPEGYLSNSTRQEVERLLGSVDTPSECGTYHAAIAFVRSVPSERLTSDFVHKLHDTWGIGNSPCNDGAILCVVAEERRVFFTSGRSFRERVSVRAAENAVDAMIGPLRYREYDAAALAGAYMIREAVRNGKVSTWGALEYNAPAILLASVGVRDISRREWIVAGVVLLSACCLWNAPCIATFALGIVLSYMNFWFTGAGCAVSAVLRSHECLVGAVVALVLGTAGEFRRASHTGRAPRPEAQPRTSRGRRPVL